MATLTPKEIAVKFDSDARTVRKFIRQDTGRVGKGHRHAIDSKTLKGMQKRFDAWIAAKSTPAADDAPQGVDEATAAALCNALGL